MVDVDIEVEGSLTVHEAHEIAHTVEEQVKEKVKNIYDIMIHVEPEGDINEDEKFGVTRKHI
jgi:divalent metal cation (Fe/Co/Zn/Cd) transporter